MMKNAVRGRKLRAWGRSDAYVRIQFGIHAFDNSPALFTDAPDNADRTQQPRGVVDQMEESRDGTKTKQTCG